MFVQAILTVRHSPPYEYCELLVLLLLHESAAEFFGFYYVVEFRRFWYSANLLVGEMIKLPKKTKKKRLSQVPGVV